MTWKRKQANWKIESPRLSSSAKSTWATTIHCSSSCPARLGRRTQGKKLPNDWGDVDAPLQCFGVEMDSLKEDDVWYYKKRRWWNVGLMEKHGWRNEHEKKPNGNYGRDKTEVWEVELFNLPMVLFKVVQEPVVVPHIQYIAVCGGKTSSPNLECSETVEDLPNAIQRTIGWSILLSWCIGFFPPLEKKLIESLRKLCEEPDCMFSEICVVWTATWVLTPINVVSSSLPSFLLYFLFW